MPTALQFENISKQYRLGLVSSRTLSHDLNRWFQMNIRGKDDPYLKLSELNDRAHHGSSDYVWALNDINLKVEQGDVLGIIGKNGAGKSTLLKILSKITSPTSGIIRAHGRIASLLEVGTGFHPEMTGRENIFMNGAIMGMTRAEIVRKMDEIVDFSGVERYLDTPVKRYSSGMIVRLGFAIAAHLEPEILVVDEVLAVGDAEFQRKAIGKMEQVSNNEGRTVLFVSHNLGAVQQLCRKLCVLKEGTVDYVGEVQEGIERYLSADVYRSRVSLSHQVRSLQKDELFLLTSFEVFQSNNRSDYFFTKDPLTIQFSYELARNIRALRIGFDILMAKTGVLVFRTFHDDMDSEIMEITKGSYGATARIPGNLFLEEEYLISVSIGIHNQRWIIFDEIKANLSFKNLDGINKIYFSDHRPGVINPPINWELKQI